MTKAQSKRVDYLIDVLVDFKQGLLDESLSADDRWVHRQVIADIEQDLIELGLTPSAIEKAF